MSKEQDERGTGKRPDYSAELKLVRQKRVSLAAENAELERKLREARTRTSATHDDEHAKKTLEAEKKRLEEEQKRTRELSERLKMELAPPQPVPVSQGQEQDPNKVEIGRRQKATRTDSDPFHNFTILRRYFGVSEFRKSEKGETGVVSKTKKLVGFK